MLSEKRIKEAEVNVNNYLKEGLLRKSEFNENIYNILKRNAQESLETASFLYNNKKSNLWIIVASYYSMFYLANALLYKIGYKVGDKISHKITADGLIVFSRVKLRQSLIEDYEDTRDEALAKIKSDELIVSLDYERKKRSLIQYNTPEEIKVSKTETSLKRAKEFMLQVRKLLES
jgi:uncharacterized protein (UPF0332 family)